MEWEGTPFRLQGRRKGREDGAVDCVGLILAAGKVIGVIPAEWDELRYGNTHNGKACMEGIGKWFAPKDKSELEAGDIVVMATNPLTVHAGILYDHPHGGLGIIHADQSVGRVVACTLSDAQRRIIRAAFSPEGIDHE